VEAGYEISAYHLNEGHVAFAALEVIRGRMKKGASFEEAKRHTASILGFTTHTPVPEGNERFDEKLVREYLQPYLDGFLSQQDREFIFNCARNREDMFDMTKLSLLLSGVCRNGVSELHGEVCRKMWGYAWGNNDPEGKNVPITSITNSVHVPYWQKPVLRSLIEEQGGIDKVSKIPDEKIWALHTEFKVKLIEKVRERLAYQLLRENAEPQDIYEKTQALLTPNAFMIGFARRFAEYKRVTMVLEDEEKLFSFMERIYRASGVPVNIIYAGKPHPNNYAGQEKITEILNIAERLSKRAAERKFQGQIVFVQGYDIDFARYLEAGVDIWLNNPIRPLEASGTSGMKAGMNGVLNVSVSDGWVPEGIVQGQNGWTFGRGDANSTNQDREELFALLEKTILPIFLKREKEGDVFSREWVRLMKNSIESITKKFNTDRMLTEYIEKMYLPAVKAAVLSVK
jgi:starch phosphorylase